MKKTTFARLSSLLILGSTFATVACVSTQPKVVQLSDDGKEVSIQLSTSDKSLISQRPVGEAKEAISVIEGRGALTLQLMTSVAELQLLANNVAEAEAKARSVLKRDIKNKSAAETLIKVAIIKKRFEEAKLIAQNTLQLDGRNADVLALKGLAHYATGELIEAREAWKKALKIDSSHIPSQMNLGALYFQNRNLALADAMFERVLKIQPRYQDATVGHALVLSAQGREAEARTILVSLLDKNSDAPLILYNLAVIEKERFQNYEQSLTYLNRYLNISGNERMIVERALSMKAELKGRVAELKKGAMSDDDLRTLADKSSQAVHGAEEASNVAREDAEKVRAPAVAKQEPATPSQKPQSQAAQDSKPVLKDDVRSLEEDIR